MDRLHCAQSEGLVAASQKAKQRVAGCGHQVKKPIRDRQGHVAVARIRNILPRGIDSFVGCNDKEARQRPANGMAVCSLYANVGVCQESTNVCLITY